MKKYSNAIFVVFLIIFAAGLWLFNSNITRVPLLSDDNFYFVKAKVVEVVEDNTVNKEVNGGSQNVKVEITSGKYKGKICEANNMNGYLYGTYCKKGTNVIVQLSSYGDELSGSIYGYDRGNFIWLIVAVLGAALFLVGGKRGLKSMLALVFTFICIIYLYIPLMYIGVSPFLAAVAVVIVVTIVSIYLICGSTKKGICAMTGTISGVLIAGVFATVFGKITRITGYNIEDIETMVYVSQNSKLQIGGVLFSEEILAEIYAALLCFRDVVQIHSCYLKHFARTFAVTSGDQRSMHINEISLLEEFVDRISGQGTYTEHCLERIGSRTQM